MTRPPRPPGRPLRRWKRRFVLLACGAMPLLTTANCDPFSGRIDFFRDDDAGFFHDFGWGFGGGHEEVVFIEEYDDCFFFDCF